MKKFTNLTNKGKEKALRKGRTVPDGDVNLAFYKSPSLSPEQNIVIIDTSQAVNEDTIDIRDQRKVYYANGLGILEDINGNQLIADKYPVISDVFSRDEDYSIEPNISEYDPRNVLPFLHVSRYFHLDFAGLVPGSEPFPYKDKYLKVVDGEGNDYVDAEGKQRYRILVARARSEFQEGYGRQSAYRVYVYVDTDLNENLYLTYNKIEIDINGVFKNQVFNHREILNPKPFFDYQPEESAVVDPENRKKKQYSTVPINIREEVLGKKRPSVDGYRAFVPKKAVSDPRLFQLFRWRVKCWFKQNYDIDPTRNAAVIRAGVLITNEDIANNAAFPSFAPYVFYNLENSNYNSNNIKFVNPLQASAPASLRLDKNQANYWLVKWDELVQNPQLMEKFDLLVWAPTKKEVNISNYLNSINHFVNNCGGTFFADTSNFSNISGWSKSSGWNLSLAPDAKTGVVSKLPIDDSTKVVAVKNATRADDLTHQLLNAEESLGGWDIDNESEDDELETVTYLRKIYPNGYSQCILSAPPRASRVLGNYTSVATPSIKSILSYQPGKKTAESQAVSDERLGATIISTSALLLTCNAMFNNNQFLNWNIDSKIYSGTAVNYIDNINLPFREGAMKLLYNIALSAVNGRIFNDRDETAHTNQWLYATDWYSSWVIDGEVLSAAERNKYKFQMGPKDSATPSLVWKRQISPKTLKQLIDGAMSDSMKLKAQGSIRKYEIEVTNSVLNGGSVEVASVDLRDQDQVWAWTEAYSPEFKVPLNLGPHIIKAEERKGDYEALDFIYKKYPSQPFSARVRVDSITTNDRFAPTQITWTATGKAVEHTKNWVPTTTSKETQIIKLYHNITGTYVADYPPYKGCTMPVGIYFKHFWNYTMGSKADATQNWPYIGLTGRYQIGSSGEVVSFIQEAINRTIGLGWVDATLLSVDGSYGQRTASAVRSFQSAMGAKYIDGVVDAETFSLIGGQCLRMEGIYWANPDGFSRSSDYTRFFQSAADNMRIKKVSDGQSGSAFSKRSWAVDGPGFISDTFFVWFDKPYKIIGIGVIPYAHDNDLLVHGVDVFSTADGNVYDFMANFDFSQSDYLLNGGWGQWYHDGHDLQYYVSPQIADGIAVTLGQNRANIPGGGTSRLIGLRDLYALVEVEKVTTIPGHWVYVDEPHEITLTATGMTEISETKDYTYTIVAQDYRTDDPNNDKRRRELYNIEWTGLSVAGNSASNGELTFNITKQGNITIRADGATRALAGDPANTAWGKWIGQPKDGKDVNTEVYYSKNEDGYINTSVRELGRIAKDEGIKLICNKDGSPYGFPDRIIPSGAGPADIQRHYVSLRLENIVPPNSFVGFYDFYRKEFVLDAQGNPKMSYIEYQARGPANIFIGVISSNETTQKLPIPDNGVDPIPFKWAMPAYGVVTRSSARIKLEPVPPGLDEHTVWPVGVRIGEFHRSIDIRPRSQPLSGWVGRHQKDHVNQMEAFYGIPESEMGGWSLMYGPPNSEIIAETPIIDSDKSIRLRRPPIHMQREPTPFISPADPVRPSFAVYTREDINSPWVKIPWSKIDDYNVSTGEIFLKEALASTDDNLIKVDYTSSSQSYYFKGTSTDLLNLNPNPGYVNNLLGKAIYIYLLPKHVRSSDGNTISQSVRTRCVGFTTDPSIFDPIRSDYNPFALQLGIIYITPKADIKDLAIIDSRRRGGGARDSSTVEEIVRIINEGSTYWDISHGSGASYQRSGFVIIRLPSELKDYMSEKDIREIIDYNITAGVKYEIEDLEGNSWS